MLPPLLTLLYTSPGASGELLEQPIIITSAANTAASFAVSLVHPFCILLSPSATRRDVVFCVFCFFFIGVEEQRVVNSYPYTPRLQKSTNKLKLELIG